jgi:hypothetical protein
MSFNNDNNNFQGNFQSTGANNANNLRDDYNSVNDRSAGSGFNDSRNVQSNTGTGLSNSGLGRTNDRSAGSGFDNSGDFQSDTGTGSFNSGLGRTTDRSTGNGLNNTDSFTNEQSGRSYDNTSSGSLGRDGINSATSNSNRRDNNLRDNAGHSNKGYDNDGPNTEPREPSGGSAGVMQSSFGGENTTTSTFEKSQGESYGRGFDGSGEKVKEDFGFDGGQETTRHQNQAGTGAGGSGYSARQDQGSRNDGNNFATEGSSGHSGHSSGHKQGLGQKLAEKAEGKLRLL